MMWGFTWTAGAPTATSSSAWPTAQRQPVNDARFALPAYDRLYERQRVLPDGMSGWP